MRKSPLSCYYDEEGKLTQRYFMPTRKQLADATPAQVRKFAYDVAYHQAAKVRSLENHVDNLKGELASTLDARLREIVGASCYMCGDHGAKWRKYIKAGVDYRLCEQCSWDCRTGKADPDSKPTPGRRVAS